MKKFIAGALASAAVISGILTSVLNANATGVNDVAAVARKYGIPETVIQQGFNEYYSEPDAYTEEDFEYAIWYIGEYHQEIINRFAPSVSEENKTEPTTESVTSAVQGNADTPVQSVTTKTNKTDNKSEVSVTKPSSQNDSNKTENSTSGGNRIPQSDFINMTLEEKQNYVASLPKDKQQEFLNSLSAEELKSIVKQLPNGDKAAIADKFVQAGDAMGVKVTVNEITDDNISMIMKDKNGKLIDIANVGVIVEDTGYDYRLIYLICGAALLAAAGGLWFLIRKCFRKSKIED